MKKKKIFQESLKLESLKFIPAKRNIKVEEEEETPFKKIENANSTNREKIGIVVDLFKKSADNVPVMFETDRQEINELIEYSKTITDLNEQQVNWFKIMAYCLSEIIPIDEQFFKVSLLSIINSTTFKSAFDKNTNERIAFGVILKDWMFGYEILSMKYDLWLEIKEHYKLQPKSLK